MIVVAYGVAIQEAVASGDVGRMREAVRLGEQYLEEWGNVPAALEALKLEIAKAERGKG